MDDRLNVEIIDDIEIDTSMPEDYGEEQECRSFPDDEPGLTLDEAIAVGHDGSAYAVNEDGATVQVNYCASGCCPGFNNGAPFWMWQDTSDVRNDVHVASYSVIRDRDIFEEFGLLADAAIWAPVTPPAHKSGVSTLHALVIAVPVITLAVRFVARHF